MVGWCGVAMSPWPSLVVVRVSVQAMVVTCGCGISFWHPLRAVQSLNAATNLVRMHPEVPMAWHRSADPCAVVSPRIGRAEAIATVRKTTNHFLAVVICERRKSIIVGSVMLSFRGGEAA